MVTLENKVIVVTGAGSGAGEAIARDFVAKGAKVAFLGRRLNSLENAAQGLPEKQVMLCVCDVADRNAVNAIVQEISDKFGTVDILVNNAGINTSQRSVADIEPSDWDYVLQVNLTGAFNMTRAVLPAMREKGDGVIINIVSTAGIRATKGAGAAYSASKHAMLSLTHNLNEEEWENGIRATAICPGEINTPLIDKREAPPSAERRAQMLQAEDISSATIFIATLPIHVSVPLLVIKPLYQIL